MNEKVKAKLSIKAEIFCIEEASREEYEDVLKMDAGELKRKIEETLIGELGDNTAVIVEEVFIEEITE